METKTTTFNRRQFVSKSTKAVTLISLAPTFSLAEGKAEAKTKLVMVGTGSRGVSSWGVELIGPYADYVEMTGLCDINLKRAEAAKKMMNLKAKIYHSDQFDLMISEQKPDIVIVATTDCYHVDYIVRAMELGCDVISEKPIATEASQCQLILDAEKKTGKKVYVGFNARYSNQSNEIKRILDSGELGKIISIDYQEYLDTDHGASYFRRWHGKNKYSGSLLVHKLSHYFDLVNWFLDAEPEVVQAMGMNSFYGSKNDFRGKNCRNCEFTKQCDFYWDITKDEESMNLYVGCEDVDQYYRDGCVWDKDIDGYDTASVQVNYDNGTLLTYTLNAFLPYEGEYVCFSGEKGRLDVRLYKRQPWQTGLTSEFRLTRDRKTTKVWSVKPGKGEHGGADILIKDNFFKPNQADPTGKRAGSRAGVLASIIGIAARKSIETHKPVKIADIINL